MESLIENLPWILACLLAVSEGLAHVPALKSNSVLQILTSLFKKAQPVAKSLADSQKKKEEEEKAE